MTRALLLAAASLSLLAACSRSDTEEAAPAAAPEAAAQPAAGGASAGPARFTVGEATVTAIADGTVPGSLDLLQGVTPAEAEALLKGAGLAVPPQLFLQAFLIDVGGQRVLVDTGAGGNVGPTGGRFAQGLTEAGAAPESINAVVISHMHPDHIGGLLDAQGRARFPTATVVVDSDEAAFWGDAQRLAAAPEANKPYFQAAQAVLAAYGDRVRRFDGGEVVPGVTVEPLPGHTPGHSAVRLRSGGQEMLFIGDTVHMAAVQMARPEVTLTFDNDADAARNARGALFRAAAGKPLLIAGPHLPFPGVGRIETAGEAYRFTPATPAAPASR